MNLRREQLAEGSFVRVDLGPSEARIVSPFGAEQDRTTFLLGVPDQRGQQLDDLHQLGTRVSEARVAVAQAAVEEAGSTDTQLQALYDPDAARQRREAMGERLGLARQMDEQLTRLHNGHIPKAPSVITRTVEKAKSMWASTISFVAKLG